MNNKTVEIFENTATSVNFEDLNINKSENIAFLVGAGISMNPPSNLPSAKFIVHKVLEKIALQEYIQLIEERGKLRYESIIEIIQSRMDKELDFMRFFNFVTEPNQIHNFLASCIMNGAGVITTNFDYLIEWALLHFLGDNMIEKIKPIITKDDYDNIDDPASFYKNLTYPVFKIHGSFQNFVTGADTRESLVTTVKSLVLDEHSAEGDFLGLKHYKKRVIEKVVKDKILIVMGYSGSDDFDISPFLQKIKGLKRLIWIEHTQATQAKESDVSGADGSISESKRLRKIAQIKDQFNLDVINSSKFYTKTEKMLVQIRTRNDFDIYYYKINTNEFIDKHLSPALNITSKITPIKTSSYTIKDLSNQNQGLPISPSQKYIEKELVEEVIKNNDFNKWAEISFKTINPLNKFLITVFILKNISEFNAAIECCHKALDYLSSSDFSTSTAASSDSTKTPSFSTSINPEKVKLDLYILLGILYAKTNDKKNSMKYMKRSEKIALAINDKPALVLIYNNLGVYYNDIKEYDAALSNYLHCFDINAEIGEESGLNTVKLNLSKIYNQKGDYTKAMDYIQEAMVYFNNNKMMSRKGECLKVLSAILFNMKEYDKAIQIAQQALTIASSLGDVMQMGLLENKLGMLYVKKVNPRLALVHFTASINCFDEIKNTTFIYEPLYNLGQLLLISKFYEQASQYLVRAFNLVMETYEFEKIANSMFAIAKCALGLKMPDKALEFAVEAENYYTAAKMSRNASLVHDFIEKLKES